MNLPEKLNQTKHVNKTLNPTWNESFILEFDPEICNKFRIEVYNYARIGKDEFLGSGDIPLEYIKKFRMNLHVDWFPLSIEKLNEKTKKKK